MRKDINNRLQQELLQQVDQAEWQWLKPHNERGALLLVSDMLELHQVGERLAADDAETVKGWLASSLISKPDADRIKGWDNRGDCRFDLLVVSPFVLIREIGSSVDAAADAALEN